MQIRFDLGLLLPVAALCAAVVCEAQQPTTRPSPAAQASRATLSGRPSATTPAIVLVHGAFADASAWNDVIPLLQERGNSVIAVQNPLTSVETDVATTRRVIDAQPGDVVLVGHSYGGAVITEAGAETPKVKALVSIAAFAPDVNVPIGALGKNYPPPPLSTALRPDAAGFLHIDTTRYHEVFAQDLPRKLTRVLAVGPKPVTSAVFSTSLKAAAWKTIAAWSLVAQQDRAINPDEERFYAKRMKARTTGGRQLSRPLPVTTKGGRPDNPGRGGERAEMTATATGGSNVTAPTHLLEAADATYAYRRFGDGLGLRERGWRPRSMSTGKECALARVRTGSSLDARQTVHSASAWCARLHRASTSLGRGRWRSAEVWRSAGCESFHSEVSNAQLPHYDGPSFSIEGGRRVRARDSTPVLRVQCAGDDFSGRDRGRRQ